MEYLASDMEPHLPNLPWKFNETHSRIKDLADFCNTLAAHYTLSDKKVQKNLEYELLRRRMKDS